MKRFTAIILAMLLVISFSACGETEETEKIPEKEKSEQTDKSDDNVTADDMKVTLSDAELDIPDDAKQICDGTTFTVFAPYPSGIPFFVTETPNGTPVNDALYNRNLALLDTLGVTVDAVDFSYYTHNQFEKIIDSVQASDHSFDVAAIHSTSSCASLILANALMPFDNLEYCDLTKPWWIKGMQDTCSIFGENYFAVSSACYNYYNVPACILYNKTLAAERNLPDIYELVRKGEWTVDKLIELTKNVSKDLDGDGEYTTNDLIAIVSNDYSQLNTWLGAFRQSTVEKGESEEPVFVVNSARMSTIIDKLNTLFHSGKRGCLWNMYSTDEGNEWKQAFAENRVLFLVSSVSTATGLRESDVDFGIIPLPKLDKNQEKYGSWTDPWHLTLCVPIDCENPEKIGIILETMAYYSYHLIYPAVVEQSIFGTGTRDTESLEMIEKYIYPNVFFDYGYIYDGYDKGYGDIIRNLVSKNSSDIGSYIAERKNSAESHFSNLYDAMQENRS